MNNHSAAFDRPVKIHVGIPSRNLTGHDLCGGLSIALLKMQQDRRYEVTVKISSGFGVDLVRNRIVSEFLDTDAEFLLMIDDDMVPPDDLLGMAEYDCDLVGGLYYAWDQTNGPFIPAYKRDGDDRYVRLELGDTENTGLREVSLVGGGCMMFHRRVFEAMPGPWFSFKVDPSGRTIINPEDFNICEKVLDHGFKVFLDTDRICGHIKKVDLRDVADLIVINRQGAMFNLLE